MNASAHPSSSYRFAPLAVLLASLITAPLGFAGPGSQFWKTPSQPAVNASPTTPGPVVACSGCADMKIVPLTTIQPQLPNGRGPLQKFVTGMQQVCQSCGSTVTTMKPTWSNARGPLAPVVLKSTHICQTTLLAAN